MVRVDHRAPLRGIGGGPPRRPRAARGGAGPCPRTRRPAPGETLLDVGCGDGLIGFGALDLLGDDGHVILSDISHDLLQRCREIASELGLADRCDFVRASADDLSAVRSSTVDVVTTRSVLIYVKDKTAAMREFHRVLRGGGRLSLFEPINRFTKADPGDDPSPIDGPKRKLDELFQAIQHPADDPMLDFDERDLLALATKAGFGEVHLELRADVAPAEPTPWDRFLDVAGNPLVPSLREAIAEALTPEEAVRYERYMRPLVEEGNRTERRAVAYLWASKLA